MSKLKILFVSGRVPWHPKAGGGSICVYNLARNLVLRGHEIDYLVPAPRELWRNDPLVNFKFESVTNFCFYPLVLYVAANRTAVKYDLIHAHGTEGFWFGIEKKFCNYRPFIMSLFYPSVSSLGRKTLFHRMASFAARNSDKVFVLSKFSKRDVCSAFNLTLTKVKIMSAGVDERFLLKEYNHRTKTKPFKLLTCGRLEHQKGIDTLIEALPIVLKKYPVELTIVGSGTCSGDYEQLARTLHVEHAVLFRGFIDNARLPELYRNSDLFVLPSRGESFGIVLAEAMASGLPVVSTSVGAIPEVVEDGENGFLVPPDDPQSLADAMLRILADTTLSCTLGRKSWERAKKYYDWKIVAKRVESVYEEVLAGGVRK